MHGAPHGSGASVSLSSICLNTINHELNYWSLNLKPNTPLMKTADIKLKDK